MGRDAFMDNILYLDTFSYYVDQIIFLKIELCNLKIYLDTLSGPAEVKYYP